MKSELSIIPGTRIALFIWVGPITLDDRERNRKEIVAFCQKEGVKNVIIHGLHQEPQTGLMQDFGFGEELPTEMRGFNIAIVRSREDKTLKFIDNVAANRGANTKSFHTLEEAQVWLTPKVSMPSKAMDGGKV